MAAMKRLLYSACALLMTLPVGARATELADVNAGLNTLSQLMNKITGDTIMAVVYDPANATSVADAQEIKKIVAGGIRMPDGSKLSAQLVGINELGKLSRARIAFLTPGLQADFTDIGTATSAASILTISTDIECVRAGKCIIGVEAKPVLTIYYSKQAADNAKIEFTQAFSMLVKQP